jgi:mRNA interferase HigB
MRVISRKALVGCWMMHPETEQPLKAWFKEVSFAKWASPNQLKLEFPSASVLRNGRVVFNIKGNNYRLVVRINYSYQLVWIRFVGSHQEYDKIDANSI